MTEDLLWITEEVAIPAAELNFRTARSSGPGGQHVQRTESKVELLFDLAASPSLSDAQRSLAFSRLAGRVDSAGVLHLSAQSSRSQLENREEVVARFRRLLAAALQPPKPRRATRPTAAARQRRLEGKRRRAAAKHLRGPVRDAE